MDKSLQPEDDEELYSNFDWIDKDKRTIMGMIDQPYIGERFIGADGDSRMVIEQDGNRTVNPIPPELIAASGVDVVTLLKAKIDFHKILEDHDAADDSEAGKMVKQIAAWLLPHSAADLSVIYRGDPPTLTLKPGTDNIHVWSENACRYCSFMPPAPANTPAHEMWQWRSSSGKHTPRRCPCPKVCLLLYVHSALQEAGIDITWVIPRWLGLA